MCRCTAPKQIPGDVKAERNTEVLCKLMKKKKKENMMEFNLAQGILWGPHRCAVVVSTHTHTHTHGYIHKPADHLPLIIAGGERFVYTFSHNLKYKAEDQCIFLGCTYFFKLQITTYDNNPVNSRLLLWNLKVTNERSVLTVIDASPCYLPLSLSTISLRVCVTNGVCFCL